MGLLLYTYSTLTRTMKDVTAILDICADSASASYKGVSIYTTSEGVLTVVNSFPTRIDDCLGEVEGVFSVAWPIEGHPEIPNIASWEFDPIDHSVLATIEGGRPGHSIDIWHERMRGYHVVGHNFYEANENAVQYSPRVGWLPYGCSETESGIWIYMTDITSGYAEAWPIVCPFTLSSDGTMYTYEGEQYEELVYSCDNRLWLYRGELYEENGRPYCGEEEGAIRGVYEYSTNVPKALKYTIPNSLCIGIEAEFSEYSQDTVNLSMDSFHGKAMFKNDSSCGIELVTVPLLPKEVYTFIDNLAISQLGTNSNCGVHVHLSRKYLTQSQLGGLVVFMNHPDNLDYITKVANRKPNSFCKQIANKSDTQSEDRYEMVNLTNKETIEIRIFAGTNHTETLKGYVRWLLDLLKWLGTNPSSYLATEFIKYQSHRKVRLKAK